MAGNRWLEKRTMFVFGAGATKACGGPLTAEILPYAYAPGFAGTRRRQDLFAQLDDCLIQHFHVPQAATDRHPDDYPPLPLLLSLLDLAIDQDRPLVFDRLQPDSRRDHWSHEKLAAARKAIEYVIFAVLDAHLRTLQRNWYADLFDVLPIGYTPHEPSVISLNYDILLDNVMFQLAEEQRGPDARPTYACEILTEAYTRRGIEYGELLKLHGSLNWLYCACCRRLDIGMSDSGRQTATCKMLQELYNQHPLEGHYAETAGCPECGTPLRAVMITPARAKDYRNPHLQRIWYRAERALRLAEHVCFIGYSLPDDDLEVIDLLRRGLGHLTGECITVVEYAAEDQAQRATARHPVLRRFESVFGKGIDWYTRGFGAWVEDARQTVGAAAGRPAVPLTASPAPPAAR
jgi:hypothetical protein